MGWSEYPIIITNLFEEVWTYMRVSILIGVEIWLIVVGLMLLQYIKKGLYKDEEIFFRWLIIKIILINWIIYGLVGKTLATWIGKEGEITMMGKMGQYMDVIISIGWVVQILWVLPWIMSRISIRKHYERNRKYYIFIVAVVVGVVTPPDIRIMTGGAVSIIGIMEVCIWWGIIQKLR